MLYARFSTGFPQVAQVAPGRGGTAAGRWHLPAAPAAGQESGTMELVEPNVVRLELRSDVVAALQSIADKEGLVKEQVAREAIELWVEHYRTYGPAFSRADDE